MSERRFAVLALGAGLVTAAVLTFPLPLHLGSAVLEDGTFDAYQFVWNIWWVRESLLRLHQNPFFTSYLFYPDGVPLLFHTFSFSLGLASVPLQLALPGGVLTAHNVLVVAAPALAVLALALLAHELTRDPWAALVGGLAGAVTGATVWYLPVLYLDCTYLITFVLWAWWRLHRLARPRDVVLALGLLLALVFASQEYALMALAILGLDSFASLVAPRAFGLPPRWRAGLVAFWGLAALALGALALVAMRAPATPPPANMVLFFSAFAAGLVTPPWVVPPVVPFWRVLYLGTGALALAPIALVWGRPTVRFWLAAAALLSLMALGPYMRWQYPFPTLQGPPPRLSLGHGFPGPYLLALKVLPLFRFFRAPYRWTVGAEVALGALAALGVAGARARIGPGSVRAIATAAALALVIGGAVLDVRGLRAPLTEAAVPAAYGTLSADPQPAAVLELPSGLRASGFAAFSSLYMYYQTGHRKYLLEGTVSRLPPDRRLVVQRAIADFAALPYVKWVVLHRDLVPESSLGAQRQVEEVDRLLVSEGELVARDGAIDVYRLRTFRPETVLAP